MTMHVAPPPVDNLRRGPVPTFSVVIPAYQSASFIGNAIESVLAQTTPPLEIIVCNDGSTDDIQGALAPYGAHLTVIDQANGGEASAKNSGIRAASGDFVAILDADDVFLPRRLEALGRLASERPDLDILTTDSYLVVNGTRVRRCFTSEFRFAERSQRHAILRYNFLPFAAPRREAVIAAGGFDETLRNIPDWDLWLRMILDGARAGLVNDALAEYHLGGENVTSDRLRVHQGKMDTLQKARRRDDLTVEERRILDFEIESEQRQVNLWRAREYLRTHHPDARRACVGVLGTRNVGARAKFNAIAGLLAPRIAARALARRDEAGVEITAGLRVSPESGTRHTPT
jgi:glycosyltransferase involved in cell wall biosynthesis